MHMCPSFSNLNLKYENHCQNVKHSPTFRKPLQLIDLKTFIFQHLLRTVIIIDLRENTINFMTSFRGRGGGINLITRHSPSKYILTYRNTVTQNYIIFFAFSFNIKSEHFLFPLVHVQHVRVKQIRNNKIIDTFTKNSQED